MEDAGWPDVHLAAQVKYRGAALRILHTNRIRPENRGPTVEPRAGTGPHKPESSREFVAPPIHATH